MVSRTRFTAAVPVLLAALFFFLAGAATTAFAQAPAPAPNFLGSAFLSAAWAPCGGAGGRAPSRDAWTTLRDCFQLSQLAEPAALPLASAARCARLATDALPPATGDFSCTALASALADAFWCGAVSGVIGRGATPLVDAATLARVDALSANASRCSDGAAGYASLVATRGIVETAPGLLPVTFLCTTEGSRLALCGHRFASLGSGPYAALALRAPFFPASGPSVCVNNIQVRCSVCDPYLDKDAVPQPYYFCLFPSIKLAIVACLKIFFLDRIAERVRLRVEDGVRTARHRVTFPAAFVPYFIQEVLAGGCYRLRQSHTRSSLNGSRFVRRVYAAFNASGGKVPLSDADRERYCDASKGIARQHALLTREKGMSTYRRAMRPAWMEMNATRDAAAQLHLRCGLRLEEEWFWAAVCKCGLQTCVEPQSRLNALFDANYALLRRPVAAYHEPHEPHHDAGKPHVDSVIVFRELGFETDPAATEFVIRCDEGTSGMTVQNAIMSLLVNAGRVARATPAVVPGASPASPKLPAAPASPGSPSKKAFALATPAAHRGFKCFTQRGKQVFLEGATTVADLAAIDSSLAFRFALPETPVPGFDETGHALAGRYTTIETELAASREAFVATAATEPARFDLHSLEQDTQGSLAIILDASWSAWFFGLMEMFVGEEVMYDAQAAMERYRYRDAIPQLQNADGSPNAAVVEMQEYRMRHCPATRSQKKKRLAEQKAAQTAEVKLAIAAAALSEAAGGELSPISGGERAAASPVGTEPFASAGSSFVNVTVSNLGDTVHSHHRQIIARAFVATPRNMVEADATRDTALQMATAYENNEGREQEVDMRVVRELYNTCFDQLTALVDHTGAPREGVLVSQPLERAPLIISLSQMYDTVLEQLCDVEGDRSAVAIDSIVAEYRPVIEERVRVVRVVTAGEQIFMTLYGINVHMLLLQTVFGLVFFAFCVRDGSTSISEATSFSRYELSYFLFMNSGTPVSLIGAASANLLSGGAARATSYFFKVADYSILAATVMMVLPALITHIIPGVVLYGWILAIGIFVGFAPTALLLMLYGRLEARWSQEQSPAVLHANRITLKKILTGIFLWNQLACLVLFTAIFQTAFNWAHLYFNRDTYRIDYLRVVVWEWDSRSTSCYLEKTYESNSNVLQFVSSFVG